MFINYYDSGDCSQLYLNGGFITYCEMFVKDSIYKERVYSYLKSLPYIKVVDKFILVHAVLYFPENCNFLDIDDLKEFYL